MKTKILLSLAAMAAIGGMGILPARADVTVGQVDSANCFPFGGGSCYLGEYQQEYDASAFSGPVTIYGLRFAAGNIGNVGGIVQNTFTLNMSNTGASHTSISGNPAANLGSNSTAVFSGTTTWNFSSAGKYAFTINFSTPFVYDPTLAGENNLLMDVNMISSTGSTNFLDQDTSNFLMARYFNGNTDGSGLVTTFVTNSSGDVPEPSQAATFAVGAFLLIGITVLARKRLGKNA